MMLSLLVEVNLNVVKKARSPARVPSEKHVCQASGGGATADKSARLCQGNE